MNEIETTTVFFAFFALRCIVPLLLTLTIGIAMNRLVDRWQAEEKAVHPAHANTGISGKSAPF